MNDTNTPTENSRKNIASSLKAAKYLLDNLFTDCGDADALELLQKLSSFQPNVRKKLISCFSMSLDSLSSLDSRKNINEISEKEASDQKFVDELFESIVLGLEELSSEKERTNLAVIDGGKSLHTRKIQNCKNGSNLIEFPGNRKRA